MAKQHSSHILHMALKGAEHKYAELKAEIAALIEHFPHLASRAGAKVSHVAVALSKGGKAALATMTGGEPPKKRRTMSAKARKAISDAQKARWAKQKARDNK